jgi:hypothetical protein
MSAIPAVVKGVSAVPSIINSIIAGLGSGGIASGIAGKAGAFDNKEALIQGSNMSWEEITKMFNLPINARYEDVYARWQNRFNTLKGPGAVSIQAGVQSPAKWKQVTKKLINKIVSAGKTGLIKYQYGPGEMSNGIAFKNALSNDPGMIEIISDYGFKNKVSSVQDIFEKMRADKDAQDRLLKYLKGAQIEYKPQYIRPNKQQNNIDVTSQVSEDGGSDIKPTEAQDGSKPEIKQDAGDAPDVDIYEDPETEAIPIYKTTRPKPKDKRPRIPPRYPRDPEKKDPEDDETDDEPDDEDKKDENKIIEKPILTQQVRARKKPVQWFPSWQFGNQSILRLTDTEKLEDLKNYSLFDLVNPILQGDQSNLLALQNKIQENRRYYNTFSNPTPEAKLPPIPSGVDAFARPLKNVYDCRMPMRDDSAYAVNYYDRYNDEQRNYLAYKLDVATRGHLQDCDLEQRINESKLKFNGLLPIDETELNPLDFKYL